MPGIPLSNQAKPITVESMSQQWHYSLTFGFENHSRRDWKVLTIGRVLLLVLVFIASGLSREAAAELMLPDMSDSSEATLSATDEQRLGEAFMREIRARIPVIDEPEISSYLNNLGYRLVSYSGTVGTGMENTNAAKTRFTFFAVKDPAINAFAVPGGFIGVNAGLILSTESESELAAVLGHEIVHIRQHHIARAIQLTDKMNPLAIAGILAAIMIGSSQAGQATMAAVTAGSIQKRIDFTRANEKEADRLGIGMLFAAGLDPRAVPSFFERLQTAHRYYGAPPEFLSTHPVTISRIADSRNRAEQYPYRQYSDSLAYHLVRSHLTVMMKKDPKESVKYFDDALRSGKYRNRTATRYGLVLALMAASDWKRARMEIDKLLKSNPDHVVFRARLADIELTNGRISDAIRIYADTLLLYPGHELLMSGYARALLEGNKPEKVVTLLDRHKEKSNRNSVLQKLLAEAFTKMGNKMGADAALAEHHYLNGHLDMAIRQLRIALKTSNGNRNENYYENSRIEARLRQFEEERRLRIRH
uniref:Putative beta-barrel assembly-enhancing protease n=1 Tax=Candidatus Kentrum sp. FW TaxID=2126338 RepID=A0A450TKH0_9GAMM|nr:MAG: Putative Zn-dependent protease, contains TPR repeats [Candidatus Kentron sp. FW]